MHTPRRIFEIGLVVAALPGLASRVPAQESSDSQNSLSVLAGQFFYNRGGDEFYPYVSIRAARSLNRFFEAELGLGYSRLATKLYSFGETIRGYDAHTPFTTADVALNATLPLKRFSPYVGISAGLFRRGGSKTYSGLALSGSSGGLAAGARLMLTQKVSLRGEVRYRSDKHNGFSHRANDGEVSVGLQHRL